MPEEDPGDDEAQSYDPAEYTYVQVANRIQADIADWADGRKLPSEPDLAEQYGVAEMTIRRAKQVLVKRGLIRILHGRGTFVINPER